MTDAKRKQLLQILVIVLCAVSFKYYYSSANVNQLRWILAPTTIAVETVTGSSFEFESHSGYLNSDKTFLIAASCSGVNFLITAFLLLSIGKLWRNRYEVQKWRFLVTSAAIAYLTTIVANTVRISTALRLQEVPAETGLFSDSQLHRIEGIVIYFGFLLLLYFIIAKANPESNRDRTKETGPFRTFFLPLAIYYATTLVLPFANGAYDQGAVFWEHVAFVLVTPILLIVPFAMIRFVVNRRRLAARYKLE